MGSKLKKLSNKKLIDSAIEQIEQETNFHIINKCYNDSYFVFKGQKNSICEFYIKEIPEFRFAFWNVNRFDSIEDLLKENKPLWSDNYHIPSKSELVLFTQYEKYIDKFKPSHSNFIVGIYRESYDDDNKHTEEWYIDHLVDMLNFMKHHRFKAIYYSSVYSRYIWDQENVLYMLYMNIKSNYEVYTFKRKRKIAYKKALRDCLKIAKKLKCFKCYITDEDYCIPRLTLYLRKLDYVEDDIYVKELRKIGKLENKHTLQLNVRHLYIYPLISTSNKTQDTKCKRTFYNMYKFTIKESDNINLLYSNLDTME